MLRIYKGAPIFLLLSFSTFTCNALDPLLSMSLSDLSKVTFSTSSRIEVPFDETIGTSYSIDRETIQRRGYQSLKDLLEHIPGFVVLHNGSLAQVAGVRGLTHESNTRTTLMINGYEITNVENTSHALLGPISLDEVEKVEVIVGPSSFFEPANTLVATINVITRKLDGVTLTTTKGSDVDYRTTIEGGKEWNDNHWWSASLSMERRKGFDALDDHVARQNMQIQSSKDRIGATDDQHNLVVRGRYEGWSGQFQVHESRIPHPLQENGELSYNAQTTSSISLRYDDKLSEKLETLAIMRVINRYTIRDPKIGENEADVMDYRIDLGANYRTGDHIIQSGFQTSKEDYVSYLTGGGDSFVDGAYPSYGLYLHDTWTKSKSLKLVMGVRADRDDILPDGDWYPGGQAAVIYKATEDWTSKVMANHSVKMPDGFASRNLLFGANNPWTGSDADPFSYARRNNTADKPEQLTSLEWQNIFYYDDRNGRVSLTLYYQKVRDFIGWAEPVTNLGDFEGTGLEGDIRHRPNDWIENWANFSWLDSTFDVYADGLTQDIVSNDENRIIGSPRLTVNLGTSIELSDGLFLSPSLHYMTQQVAYDINTAAYKDINNRYYLNVGLLWDDAFNVNDMKLRFRVRNIFDNRDYIALSWMQGEYQPRGLNANFSIEYKF